MPVHSPPTTSCSTGNMPPIPPPRLRRSATTETPRVEKVDPLTVRVRFEKPTPFWTRMFVGSTGMIIPKHLFDTYKSAGSRDAPGNLRPVGTGPHRFVEFKLGDIISGVRKPTR